MKTRIGWFGKDIREITRVNCLHRLAQSITCVTTVILRIFCTVQRTRRRCTVSFIVVVVVQYCCGRVGIIPLVGVAKTGSGKGHHQRWSGQTGSGRGWPEVVLVWWLGAMPLLLLLGGCICSTSMLQTCPSKYFHLWCHLFFKWSPGVPVWPCTSFGHRLKGGDVMNGMYVKWYKGCKRIRFRWIQFR